MDNDLNRPLNKNELLAYEKLKLKWKEIPVEDIILDGLYLNCIRLVRDYFEKFLKIDLKPNRIIGIGLKSVLQLLADKDLRGAETLLEHMKFDSNQKIYQICFYTPYKQLRDYLLSILIERKKLNENELVDIAYLRELESAYTGRSYEQAKKNLPSYRNIAFTSNELSKKENFICKEIVNEKTEGISKRYAQFLLDWIREWPLSTRQQILAESLTLNDEIRSDIQIDPRYLWQTLLEENNMKLIQEWIEFSYSNETISLPNERLFSIKLNQEMIEMISNFTAMSDDQRNALLNKLAKFNIFTQREENNFNLKLNRLSSSETLFDESLFNLRDDEFHLRFIMSLIKRKMIPFDFIWSYLNFYNKMFPTRSAQILLGQSPYAEINSSKCLKMLMAFRQNMNIQNLDSATYFSNVCLKNFEFHLNDVENLQVATLFSNKYKEHHLVALALSLYFDIPLSSNESVVLEHLVEEYPSLRLIIDVKHTNNPISIYSLLQEQSKLDVSKLFSWQKSNTFSLFKQEDKLSPMREILSFEDQDFAKRFAYKEHLDYAYFLKQGRPFFAYNHFIQSQYAKFGKINRTVMEEARLRTNLILIENYEESKICNSCLIFTELINADSFKLKLNLYFMNLLSNHYRKHGMEESMIGEKCKSIFIEFLKGEIHAERMVLLFEHVLTTMIKENFTLQTMFTMSACLTWLPLMCFCKAHNLTYSCKYLHLCAESNQWLMYLIFAQIFQIPRYQVISGLEHFSDIGLKQHLEYALHNLITASTRKESDSISNKLKNAFKRTESKFSSIIANNWFNKKPKKGSKKTNKTTHLNSSDSSENDDFEIAFDLDKPVEKQKDCLESIDFYELLISCQNTNEPVLQLQLEALRWHAPVLAVFATFYQQHDKISCLCTFLNASMKYNHHKAIGHRANPQSKENKTVLFNLNELKEAIQTAVSQSYLRILLNALKIFMPKTILDIYVEFLYHIFVVKDVHRADKLHSNYKHELVKLTLNKHQSHIPLEWYEEVISKLTRICILKCNNIENLQNLSFILGQGNEYRRLIELVYTLKKNKISVNCEEWLEIDDKSDQFNEICFKVIEELLKLQKFNEAEELASYCELSNDRIHLARFGRQIELLRLNNDFEEILEFWKNAHIQLMQIGIKDSDFIDFLKFQSTMSHLMLEKIVLLNLICQLCPNDLESSKNLWELLLNLVSENKKKNDNSNLRDIFKKMLLFGVLKADPIKEFVEHVIKEGRVNDFTESSKLSEQDKDSLNILLYNLVDIGKLAQSYVITKYFRYFNQDFRILLNMVYICLDMISPDEVDFSTQKLEPSSLKGIKLTNVLRSLSRVSVTEGSNESLKDKVEFLEKLVGLCHYGNKFSKRILLDFKLATQILNMNYIKLIRENEWVILKKILYTNSSKKFDLARQFVKAYDLNYKSLCDFLYEELLLSLKLHVSLNRNVQVSSSAPSEQTFMFDLNSGGEFSKLIRMFENQVNLFGSKLLEKSHEMLLVAKSAEDFAILVELLVKSHDCFIHSCSMDGISNILSESKLCADKLEKAGEFNLMIRLLTGIAHYTEMTYIMDYLWNNHQFEMLFGKGICKDNKLKLALLDYLKRNHPNDNETYTMVTLNFTMHREIAAMLEEAAYQQLKLLENKQLGNSSENLTYLQSILQYFSDAAQSYMKEDCVRQAEVCIKKARLVALQINFLSNNITIVNLNSSAVSKFLINHSKFWEAFIVSEAYEKKSDWPQVLLNQYVLFNNEKYLADFKMYIGLGNNLIEECANRFKQLNEASKLNAQCVQNMKFLLKQVKDIGLRYKLASSLDFNDLVNEMMSKKYSFIIKDLVLNKRV